MTTLQEKELAAELNILVQTCHNASLAAHWWHDLDHLNPHVVPTKIALMHSELSEALEGYRKNLPDEHLPHRKSVEVELADAIIRICDLAGWLQLDLGGAFVEKLAYNKTREDHKMVSRSETHGKRF